MNILHEGLLRLGFDKGENKVRTETFYFYFTAKANDNGITKYAVTPAVSQDYENEYSYLYQLTKKTTCKV